MFELFIKNKLIYSSQSGFKLGYFYINKLFFITREVYSSFDGGLEVRSIFLDIVKVFDKVWHDGIFFKLTENDISGNLLNLLRYFLNETKKRSNSERAIFYMEKCQCWSTSRLHTQSFIVFDLH